MRLNWVGRYHEFDGFGRFNSRVVKALLHQGAEVHFLTQGHVSMPQWMQDMNGIDWSHLTISCVPPAEVSEVPGRHWLYTMCEGSRIPPEWANRVNASGVERILVPCEHNRTALQESGVLPPIDVVPGGTDPLEFIYRGRSQNKNYTFLCFADRGYRKGWEEVWTAFYKAFGGKTTGNQDVRLIIKARHNNTLRLMHDAEGRDPRIVYQVSDPAIINDTYAMCDCVVIPSRCEGWGMPHREAAMMGLPVLTQRVGGLDDGHLDEWAVVIPTAKTCPIPKEGDLFLGEWSVVDIDALATAMLSCYNKPEWGIAKGRAASQWLGRNQTWSHTAGHIMDLYNGNNLERTTLSGNREVERPLHL